MPKNRVILKNMLVLLAGALLFCCATVVSAAYTVDFSPVGGSTIASGQVITITLNGAASGDTLTVNVITSANTATSYIPDFYLPFNMTSSSIAVTGTNVKALSISVTAPAPDGNTYTRTNVIPPATLTSHATLYTGTYTNNGVTITPETDSTTSVGLTVNGIISQYAGGSPQLLLQTTGATARSVITVTVGEESARYYIQIPTTGEGGDTGSGASSGTGSQLGPTQPTTLPTTQPIEPDTVTVTGTGSKGSTISAGNIEGMSGATAGWTTNITNTSSGATISTTITKVPDAPTLAAFQSAYLVKGQGIDAVAYTMIVTKTGGISTGPATITMQVPLSWVESHGGVNNISIVRQGDSGETTILTTTYDVDQTTGMVTFTATTPVNGLCVFSIVAIKSSSVAGAGTTTETQYAGNAPDTTQAASQSASAAATKTPLPLFVPLSALIIAIAGLALHRKL